MATALLTRTDEATKTTIDDDYEIVPHAPHERFDEWDHAYDTQIPVDVMTFSDKDEELGKLRIALVVPDLSEGATKILADMHRKYKCNACKRTTNVMCRFRRKDGSSYFSGQRGLFSDLSEAVEKGKEIRPFVVRPPSDVLQSSTGRTQIDHLQNFIFGNDRRMWATQTYMNKLDAIVEREHERTGQGKKKLREEWKRILRQKQETLEQRLRKEFENGTLTFSKYREIHESEDLFVHLGPSHPNDLSRGPTGFFEAYSTAKTFRKFTMTAWQKYLASNFKRHMNMFMRLMTDGDGSTNALEHVARLLKEKIKYGETMAKSTEWALFFLKEFCAAPNAFERSKVVVRAMIKQDLGKSPSKWTENPVVPLNLIQFGGNVLDAMISANGENYEESFIGLMESRLKPSTYRRATTAPTSEEAGMIIEEMREEGYEGQCIASLSVLEKTHPTYVSIPQKEKDVFGSLSDIAKVLPGGTSKKARGRIARFGAVEGPPRFPESITDLMAAIRKNPKQWEGLEVKFVNSGAACAISEIFGDFHKTMKKTVGKFPWRFLNNRPLTIVGIRRGVWYKIRGMCTSRSANAPNVFIFPEGARYTKSTPLTNALFAEFFTSDYFHWRKALEVLCNNPVLDRKDGRTDLAYGVGESAKNESKMTTIHFRLGSREFSISEM